MVEMTLRDRYVELHNLYVRKYREAKKEGKNHVADWYENRILGYKKLIAWEEQKK